MKNCVQAIKRTLWSSPLRTFFLLLLVSCWGMALAHPEKIGSEKLMRTPVGPRIFYVTQNGAGLKDGSSWGNAYEGTQLQTAIDDAKTYSMNSVNAVAQVWVATGTYKPTTDSDRTISFQMKSFVEIYGGFSGSELQLSERPSINLTTPSSATLSGNIGESTDDSDNSCHVVRNSGVGINSSAVLDGFVITKGNANTDIIPGGFQGGGLVNSNASPIIRHCYFTGNYAISGAAINIEGSGPGSNPSPVITDCIFSQNTAETGAAVGAQQFVNGSVNVSIIRCSFLGNQASSNGGAIYTKNDQSGAITLTFSNCSFTGNSAETGGAFYDNAGSSLTFTNCSFALNTATTAGGVARIQEGSQTFTNCSFAGNTSPEGGVFKSSLAPTVANCVFWNNGGSNTLVMESGALVAASYSLMDASVTGYSGATNLTTDQSPFFSNTDLQLLACSPAIDSGDPTSSTTTSGTTDLADKPRFYNAGQIDRGAFEFQGGTLAVSITANPSLTITQGQSVTLTAAGASLYTWSNTATSPVISTSIAGPYSVTGTTAGCSSSTTVTVTVLSPATASLSGSATLCEGQPATLSIALTGTQPWSLTYTDGTTPVNLNGITSSPYTFTVNPGSTTAYTLLGVSTAEMPTDGMVSGSATVTRIPAASPPILTPSSTSVIQNTPFVTLTISNCPGTLNWSATNSTSGTGTTISVPTSAIGTIVYSATCVSTCTTLPGSATVTIAPSEVSGSFDGFIYGADCSTFRGWAWDRNKPNTVFSVDIFDGPKFLESIPANEFRQDLKDAGKGNGIHAFRWSISDALKDGQVHYLSARVAGSSFYLKDSPKALICESGTTSPPNKQPVAPTMTPLTAQQGVAFTTTLPAFTDPEGSTLSYGLVSLPTGLTFTGATRQISGTPTASGLFVLTYSATDDKGATNSVSFNLTVNPAATTPVTGSFEGYLDKVECGTIRGWVWDRNKPNTPLTVEFYTGTTVWGSVVANIYRQDLKDAGKGNGAHAYSFTVPNALKDGTMRLIRARVSGSTYDLKDSGKPLTCASPSPVRLSAESNEGLQVTVLGNPVFDQLQVEVRGAEGQSLRLQLTDASGRLISQRQIEVAKPVEQQTFSVIQQPAGLLLLRVNSGSKSLTLKVLKQ